MSIDIYFNLQDFLQMLTKAKNQTKDVVAGLGEIGKPIYRVISKTTNTIGYDINQNLIDKKKLKKFENFDTRFLHICYPFNEKFSSNIKELFKLFSPSGIIIHSTIRPRTTEKLQKMFRKPIIYSATRGIHRRMFQDLKRYTKFYSIYSWAPKANWASKEFEKTLNKAQIKSKKMSSPLVLELAKIIVDTSYYGWLINYAQLSNIIAIQNKVDYDEMWSFADEIHKFLGNRPKLFPGFIGGHCVIPNLELMHDKNLDLINEINNLYFKKVKNTKSISKKYVKAKQSYDKK